jgi:hypothetical protein
MSARATDPTLERTLARLRGGLRALLGLRGAALVVATAAAVLAAAYVLDRALHLPGPIRLFHLALCVGAVGFVAVRSLALPLARPLPDDRAALLVERVFPELRERLVSAVQLSQRPSPGESDALVARLGEEARAAVRHLPVREVLAPRRPLALAGAALALAASVAFLFGRDPEAARVFAQRFLGANVDWPRRTTLEVRLPERSGTIRVDRGLGTIRVGLPRGADLPVRILAEGVVPDEVRVHVEGSRPHAATRTGGSEFAYTLRSVIEPLSFTVTGGDDQDEDPLVLVTPRVPPEVASVAVDLVHPPYANLEPERREGGTIEALVGTEATVRVVGTEGTVAGTLRFQRTGREIALERAGDLAGDGVPLSARFGVEETDRYLIVLRDEEGFTTPTPASFPIVALPDRRPEVRLFAPGRSDLDATPGGAVPLRVLVTDDYGIRDVRLRWKFGTDGPSSDLSLVAETPEPPSRPPREHSAWRRLEISSLAAASPQAPEEGIRAPREGDVIGLVVEAQDNRPEPNRSESIPLRVVVLPRVEVLRKLNDTLTRVKEEVESLGRLQRDQIERLRDLVGAVEGDDHVGRESYSFVSASVGQGRVTGQGRRIESDFLDVFETAAYNRLDRASESAIEALERAEAQLWEARGSIRGRSGGDLGSPTASERAGALLERRRAGEIGALEFIGKVLDMLEVAHEISSGLSPSATEALERAATAVEPAEVRERLGEARAAQDQIVAAIDRLLLLLAEWDNYQAVVGLTREILERQKMLNEQLREYLRRKER